MGKARIAFALVIVAIAGALVPSAIRPTAAVAAGSLDVTIGDLTIAEGNSSFQYAQVPVVLTQTPTTNVTVDFTIVGETADLGSDWTGVSSGSLLFRPGSVANVVKLRVLGDADPEPDEGLRITLSNASGAAVADDTGSVTVLDDDTTPVPGVSVGDVVVPEGDTKTRTAKVPITLSAPAAANVTITLTRSGASTAVTKVDDKAAATKAVVIRAGKSGGLVSVPVAADLLRERDEVVKIDASSSSLPIARGTGTVTIRDDASDAGPVVVAGPTDNIYAPPAAIGKGPPGELVWSKVVSSNVTSTQHLIGYRSIGQRGKPIYVTARVFIPAGAEPPGGREVVAWAEGTTGLDDACAPSKSYSVPALTNLLANGYVVVATDYEGLGTPGAHAYNNARSEAQTVFDSIRAVSELGVNTTGRAVVYGGSRGGHAAVATAERRSYAPDVEMLGAIGLGAGVVKPTDDGLVDYAMTSYYKAFLMMYIRGLQQLYGTGNASVKSLVNYYMIQPGVAELPNADGCNIPVIPYFGNISPEQLFRLTRPAIPADVNVLRQDATVGAIGSQIPIVLMSGTDDPIVPPFAIDDWQAWACAQPGRTGPIEKRWYPGGHFPTPAADITNWIADRFAGVPASDSC